MRIDEYALMNSLKLRSEGSVDKALRNNNL